MRSFKIIILILTLSAIIVSAASCGNSETSDGKNTEESSVAGSSSDAEAEASEVSSDAPDSGAETQKKTEYAENNPGEDHGDLVAASFSRGGGSDPEDTFSFYVHEKDGDFLLDFIYYDKDGNKQEDSKTMTGEDMDALREIYEKCGYEKLVGQKAAPDLGDDDTEAPSYHLSGTYSDGRSFSTGDPGEGGAELESFFKALID